MVYNIRVHPDAVRFLRELDADTRDKIKLTGTWKMILSGIDQKLILKN
ncbi:MAG TPA: hypothetical protein VIO58_15725 [Candidatus Methanoperedens sp.]